MHDLVIRNGHRRRRHRRARPAGRRRHRRRPHRRRRDRRRPRAARDRRRRPARHARAGSTSTRTTTARPPGTPSCTPSGWHGVTTVVMGNCGVGFAPARPDRHDWLIQLMEGVEDIPGTALAEGMSWNWETLPEYLDELDAHAACARRRRAGAARRGARLRAGRARRGNERGHPRRDRGDGAPSCARRIEAGAVGFSTTRTIAPPGQGRRAGRRARPPRADELLGIGRRPGRAPARGSSRSRQRHDRPRRRARLDGRDLPRRRDGPPVTFSVLQDDFDPDRWRTLLDRRGRGQRATARGLVPAGRGQAGVGAGRASSRASTRSSRHDAYRAVADLPLDRARRRAARPRGARGDPRRGRPGRAGASRRSSAEPRTSSSRSATRPTTSRPPTAASRRIAEREGRTPDGGRLRPDARARRPRAALLADARLRRRRLRTHRARCCATRAPCSGLGDGGAHCGVLCDASLPTFMLTPLGPRPRTAATRLPLEQVVHLPDPAHRVALRLRRPGRARARLPRRRQRHRLRRRSRSRRPRWSTTCRPAAAA